MVSASHILWNRRVHHCLHKSLPAAPFVSQTSPVNAPSHVLKNYFNIILPSTRMSSKWSRSLRFSPPKPCIHLFWLSYLLHALSSHFSWFDQSNKFLVRSTDHKAPRFLPCLASLLPCPSYDQISLLSTPFSNTLNLCYFLIVRDQVSYKPEKSHVTCIRLP